LRAHAYQKRAFIEFIDKYKTCLTWSGSGNFNPENSLHYSEGKYQFEIYGEIYLIRSDGSRMHIDTIEKLIEKGLVR